MVAFIGYDDNKYSIIYSLNSHIIIFIHDVKELSFSYEVTNKYSLTPINSCEQLEGFSYHFFKENCSESSRKAYLAFLLYKKSHFNVNPISWTLRKIN